MEAKQDDAIGATVELLHDQLRGGLGFGQRHQPAGAGQRQQHGVEPLPCRIDPTFDLCQDNVEVPGPTGGALDSNEGEPGPFYLQGDHHGVIRYRNITIAVPK